MNLEGVQLLARLAEVLNVQQDLDRALEMICKEIAEAFEVPIVGVYLFDPKSERFTLKAACGLEDNLHKTYASLPYHLLEEGDRYGRFVRVIPNSDGLVRGLLRTSVVVDLIREGKPIGALLLASEEELSPSEEEVHILECTAHQISLAISYFLLLEQLRGSSVKAREEERRYIARELHDQLGQALTGLKLMVESKAKESPENRALKEIQELIGQIISQLRGLLFELQPSAVVRKGLLRALQCYFERYTDQTGVRVIFNSSGLRRKLPSEVKIVVFRIIQEALTNVARHAKVDEVKVEVKADRDRITLVVEDRGVGFDPEPALKSGTTYGLTSMLDRATALGGWLRIDSAPGKGTRIAAEIPLKPHVRSSTDKTISVNTDGH